MDTIVVASSEKTILVLIFVVASASASPSASFVLCACAVVHVENLCFWRTKHKDNILGQRIAYFGFKYIFDLSYIGHDLPSGSRVLNNDADSQSAMFNH